MTVNILSYLTFLPLFFALVILLLPGQFQRFNKWLALGASAVQLVLLFPLLQAYRLANDTTLLFEESAYQFIEKSSWFNFSLGTLGNFQANYFLGVDGLSLSMVVLSVIMLFFGVIASWKIEKRSKGYFSLYLLLSTSILGCFLALDALLFYVFFEFMLLPMFFLIGIWGGERREYASIKFFIYTLVGSLFILIVFLGQYASVIDINQMMLDLGQSKAQIQESLVQGKLATEHLVHSFSMLDWADRANYIPESVFYRIDGDTLEITRWAFIAVLIGFGVKLAIVPVHTWLPDAHVEAPTAGSVLLAALLLKVGGYGLIRMGYAVFPAEAVSLSWWVGLFGVISIVYGGYNALAQSNLKKLIAYSSVAHMGFVLLGLASGTVEGINGAVYQMFAHGFISGMLFILAGVLYDRTHNLEIENYRGIAGKMPYYTAFVTIGFFASLGLPGFAGFIAEIMVFIGAFSSSLLPKWMVILALFGLVIGAAYYLWTLQRMFFGELWLKAKTIYDKDLIDLKSREYLMLVPLTGLIVLFGVKPALVLDYITPAVTNLVEILTK